MTENEPPVSRLGDEPPKVRDEPRRGIGPGQNTADSVDADRAGMPSGFTRLETLRGVMFLLVSVWWIVMLLAIAALGPGFAIAWPENVHEAEGVMRVSDAFNHSDGRLYHALGRLGALIAVLWMAGAVWKGSRASSSGFRAVFLLLGSAAVLLPLGTTYVATLLLPSGTTPRTLSNPYGVQWASEMHIGYYTDGLTTEALFGFGNACVMFLLMYALGSGFLKRPGGLRGIRESGFVSALTSRPAKRATLLGLSLVILASAATYMLSNSAWKLLFSD